MFGFGFDNISGGGFIWLLNLSEGPQFKIVW